MKIGNYIIKRAADDLEVRNVSISDPALAEYLGLSNSNGLTVTEEKALGITAYYRAISIVAGTIAGLPLKTFKRLDDGSKERVQSFLDNPAGPYGLTPFAWKELVMLHLLNHGEAFLLHIYNNAGVLIGLWPIHPLAVSKVEWRGFIKEFTVSREDGTQVVYGENELTHVMGLSLDGTRGIAPITLFRNAFKLGLAGELAATRSFTDGLLIGGLVTPEKDVEEDEALSIINNIRNKSTGVENSGDIILINRHLKFTPWTMTHEDAQFIESREFQVVEFARMIGIPPHLLGATEKQTSWGTGVAEQNIGLSRFTLMPWTSRLEEALSRLLMKTKFTEFDYAGLLQGSPAQEIDLLIKQVGGPFMTVDEARAIRNLPPLTRKQREELNKTNSQQTAQGGDNA